MWALRSPVKTIPVVTLACLAAVLVLLSGCTSNGPLPGENGSAVGSQGPGTPVTLAPNTTGTAVPAADLVRLALRESDLQPPWTLLHEGPTLSPEQLTPGSQPGYRGGYAFTAGTLSHDQVVNSIDQTILVFVTPGSSRDLRELFATSFPSISADTVTWLTDPGIGDQSVAFTYRAPVTGGEGNASVKGYAYLFRKGNVYEMLLVQGPDTDQAFAASIASKVASRLP